MAAGAMGTVTAEGCPPPAPVAVASISPEPASGKQSLFRDISPDTAEQKSELTVWPSASNTTVGIQDASGS